MGGLSLLSAGNWGAVALSIAGVVLALFKFLKWLIEFVAARMDVGHARIVQRLDHVETELDAFREVAMYLMSALAKADPDNPALHHAAQILRLTAPITKFTLDELVERLGTVPGTRAAE